MTLDEMAAKAAAAGHPLSEHALRLAESDLDQKDVAKCDACGLTWPLSLLDGRSPPEAEDPETADWERLECPVCYGPDWSEM